MSVSQLDTAVIGVVLGNLLRKALEIEPGIEFGITFGKVLGVEFGNTLGTKLSKALGTELDLLLMKTLHK